VKRLFITVFSLALAALLPAHSVQVLPPGPVLITTSTATAPKSGVVGQEWSGDFVAAVEGGIRDEGVPADQIIWKWRASVIKDGPDSEDILETGIGEKSNAIAASFDPATGSKKTRLTLRFIEPGVVYVSVVVELANKQANTIGVSVARVYKITITPSAK
jgi:hypothetical protein